MSGWRDYPSEMPLLREIDDATAEAVLRGDDVPAEFEPLVSAIAALRSAPQPPVRPTAELATRMAAGDFAGSRASGRGRYSAGRRSVRNRSARVRLAALPLRAKIAAAVALAGGGLATATVAGALPEPAQQRVQSVIESVTPIEFRAPADFGREVADDARDGGVDGREVREKARQLGANPDRAAEPGSGRAAAPGSDRPGPPRDTKRPTVPSLPHPTPRPPDDVVPADPSRPKQPEVTPAPPVELPVEPGPPTNRRGIPEPPNPTDERPVEPRPVD